MFCLILVLYLTRPDGGFFSSPRYDTSTLVALVAVVVFLDQKKKTVFGLRRVEIFFFGKFLEKDLNLLKGAF